jgi:sulfate adenylyltransferase subunit 1
MNTAAALRFITCGSVDDGKSTLIGRLLFDSRAVLQDQLEGVTRQHASGQEVDLALLTDGLSAEREQGITIDVAYRYFSNGRRKFIIGDAPGHEQYTRNMVTAASSADAAVVLVDATKLAWAQGEGAKAHDLLPQTRRHSLLCALLRVPSIVFAVNKLDAVAEPELAFNRISAALTQFAADAKIVVAATVPVSALKGYNVVDAATSGWAGYFGATLLDILERLPSGDTAPASAPIAVVSPAQRDTAFTVQWVEKFSQSADTSKGRRVFWGKVAQGVLQPGQSVQHWPSGKTAVVAQVLNHVRALQPQGLGAPHSAGVVLDRELDVSRGDYLCAANAYQPSNTVSATVAWMDDEPLLPGRTYLALHGQRWVKAKVTRIVHRLDVNTLARSEASELPGNAMGQIELRLQDALPLLPFAQSRQLGAMILVDSASHRTAGAVLVDTVL